MNSSQFEADHCDSPALCANLTCGKKCYFGSCGLDGTCQCKQGYSGENCEKRMSINYQIL